MTTTQGTENPVGDEIDDGARAVAGLLATSGRPWGIASRDIPALQRGTGSQAVVEALGEVRALGGDTLLLLGTPRQASPTLDRVELAEVGVEADRLGIELAASIGSVHPDRYRPDDAALLLAGGRHLGVTSYHVTFGVMADRFAAAPTWEEQLVAGVGPLRRLVWEAERPVVLRTHEEMTTMELTRLIDDIGHDGLCVGFSPVNVVTRLEDVTAAFNRLSGLIHTLFLDDCVLPRTHSGLARRLWLLGCGCVPWQDLLTSTSPQVTAVVDIHQAEFDMPVYDADWLRHQPDLTAIELSAVYQRSCDRDDGQVEHERRGRHARRLLDQANKIRRLGLTA